jgi:anti-anti-sigma factor
VDLNARLDRIGGRAVLGLTGEIDLASIPRLQDALTRAVSAHPGDALHVDLDGVHACDDCGLGVILGAAGRLRAAGGDLVVVCSAGSLRDRLTATGFDRAVSVVSSLSSAVP